jgi:Glutamine synthetase, beta-Grasp domain
LIRGCEFSSKIRDPDPTPGRKAPNETAEPKGSMMSAVKNALKLIKDEEVEYVDIRFTDPKGKLQHVTLVADLVDEDFFEEGFMFDGSSIAGWKSISPT